MDLWKFFYCRTLEPIDEASGSLLSPSDISFDKTEEDLEKSYLRNGKPWKRSMSVQPPPAVEEEDYEITPPGKRTRRADVRFLIMIINDFFFVEILQSI